MQAAIWVASQSFGVSAFLIALAGLFLHTILLCWFGTVLGGLFTGVRIVMPPRSLRAVLGCLVAIPYRTLWPLCTPGLTGMTLMNVLDSTGALKHLPFIPDLVIAVVFSAPIPLLLWLFSGTRLHLTMLRLMDARVVRV